MNDRIKIDGKTMRMGAQMDARGKENSEWFMLGVNEGQETELEVLAEVWEGCATIDEMGQAFHNYMIEQFGIERWVEARNEAK